MTGTFEVHTTDYHTAGEPFRIVVAGVPAIPGATVADRRVAAQASASVDLVRRLLCHEPRGHADMYGGFPVPPDDAHADLGVVFWHNDGYSTACGHGTIALATWAVESGQVAAGPDATTEVVVDVPSGRVVARVRCVAGRVADVTWANVPAWVLARGVEVPTSRGVLTVDLAWGGAFYASLPAGDAGLAVDPRHCPALIAAGREVRDALNARRAAEHPTDPRLSGVYGTIFHEELADEPDGPRQRNVTVFADGQIDRSPCGSGSSARAALLADGGHLGPGRVLHHESIVGTSFRVRAAQPVHEHGRPAWITEVEGVARRTGEHRFVLEADDALGTGFVLR